MQREIFTDFEGEKSRVSLFRKQRGRWTRTQKRIIEILADPLCSIMTNRQIAKVCDIAESYIYKLMKDEDFLAEVDRQRKSDVTTIKLKAKLWKALFYQIHLYPEKIRTAAQMLKELNQGPLVQQTYIQKYENMEPQEVDSRLERVLAMRKREESAIAES